MSSYHIDQSGRIVKQVPETKFCKGCLYNPDNVGGNEDCKHTAPVENRGVHGTLCGTNNTIFKLVDTTE
jgi:hypothetical protein